MAKAKAGRVAIHDLMKMVNKKAGRNVAHDLTGENPTSVKEWIPTGSRWLDSIVSKGRIAGIPVVFGAGRMRPRAINVHSSFICGVCAGDSRGVARSNRGSISIYLGLVGADAFYL